MNKIEIVEVSSGFSNIQNEIISKKAYDDRGLGKRSNSGNDTFYCVEIPEGFEAKKIEYADGSIQERIVRSSDGKEFLPCEVNEDCITFKYDDPYEHDELWATPIRVSARIVERW